MKKFPEMRSDAAASRLDLRGRRAPANFVYVAFAFATAALAVSASAENLFGEIFRRRYDIITVTDASPAGRKIAPPTVDHPVRYALIYQGEMRFGGGWAGEKAPDDRAAIKLLEALLKTQNYLLADETHPPEQTLVFGWGLVQGGQMRLLGMDKLPLLRDYAVEGGSPLQYTMIQNGVSGQLLTMTQDHYFLGVVRSFATATVHDPDPTELWETRFGCAANGHYLVEALPAMVAAAAPSFGRESLKPTLTAYDPARKEVIQFGDLQVLDEKSGSPKTPAPPTSK